MYLIFHPQFKYMFHIFTFIVKLLENIFICADIDECFNSPCLNNASGCKNTFGSYQCKCAPGYTGVYCQIGKLNYSYVLLISVHGLWCDWPLFVPPLKRYQKYRYSNYTSLPSLIVPKKMKQCIEIKLF